VAVSAQIWPEIGLGKLVGRVVRGLAVGFAVKFVRPQPFELLETLMAPPAA
jgi:hypothetical protein